MTTQPFKRFESGSGRFLFSIHYASGEKGKHVRADGNGGKLARGFYYCLALQEESPALIGPFQNQTIAANAARDTIALAQITTQHESPTIKAIYPLKAGGMGATLSNGQKVRLIAPALGHTLPRLGQSLEPDQFESL